MDDNLSWYVLRTKARKELRVADYIKNLGYEVYVPSRQVVRIWSDRKKKIIEPYIPSYIFIKTNEAKRNNIYPLRDAAYYMHWLGKAVVLRNVEIERMRKLFDGIDKEYNEFSGFETGSNVIIKTGAFCGREGLVEASNGKYLSLYIPSIGVQIKVEKRKHEFELVD